MFDDDAPFHSWSFVLAGAVVFGGLFGLVAWLAEVLLGSRPSLTPGVLSLAAAAAIGFIVAALLVRQAGPRRPRRSSPSNDTDA